MSPKLLANLGITITTITLGLGVNSLAQAQTPATSIPEISWESHLSSFGLDEQSNIGKTFVFRCPPAPADTYYGYGVTGTDNYEAKSKICKTAVHAGMITREGGTVTLQLDGGQSVYTASERNGVKSRNGKASDRSFFFVGTPVFNNNNSNPNSASGDSNPIQRGVEKGVESGIEDGVRDALRGLF